MTKPKDGHIDGASEQQEVEVSSDNSHPANDFGSADAGGFLPGGSGTPKEGLQAVGNPPLGQECKATKDVLEDIKNLTANQLREKYKKEYKRWDNMKQRCKKKGYTLDPRFEKFSDFLTYMGSIPDSSYTLDRIDNHDLTYGPENCRWADKYTQNSNKSNNIYATHNGKTHTLAQWASITQQNPNTLYKRKKAGWSDEEIVTGVREKIVSDPWVNTPWPTENRETWERKYQSLVLKGETRSRLEFMAEYSVKKLKVLKMDFIGLQESHGEEDSALLTHAHEEILKWEKIAENAARRLAYKQNRDRFISREASLGKHHESVLFDLLNAPPQIESDLAESNS